MVKHLPDSSWWVLLVLLLSIPIGTSVSQYRYARAFPHELFAPKHATGCQGIAVDPEGKVWIQPYNAIEHLWDDSLQSYTDAQTLHVFYPDGTPTDFSPLSSVSIDGVQHFFTGYPHGLSTDKHGNIIASFSDDLYRINYITAEGMNHITPCKDSVLAAPASDREGFIYVGFIWKGAGPIQIIDGTSFTVIGTIPIQRAGFSRGLAVSADGREVYFAGFQDRQVYVYERDDGSGLSYRLQKDILHGFSTESFARHPRSGRIWMSSGSGLDPPNIHMWVNSSYMSHTWYEYDPIGGEVTDSITWHNVEDPYIQRPRGIAFSPTGDTAYVAMFTYGENLSPMVQMFVAESLARYVTLLRPQEASLLYGGEDDTIYWVSHLVRSLSIEYSVDGGYEWLPITESVDASRGMFPWTVPNITSDHALLRLVDPEAASFHDLSLADGSIDTSTRFTVRARFWRTSWFKSLLGLAALFMVLAYHVIRTRKHRHERLRSSQLQFESGESERRRLAAELHDGLGQNLLLASNEIQQFLANGNGSTGELRHAETLLEESIRDIRSMSSSLHPHILDRLGFCDALSSLIGSVSHATGLDIAHTCGRIDGIFPKEVETHIYRIIQEALSNIVRHARAQHASVKIVQEPKHIVIEIADDGEGFMLEHPEVVSLFSGDTSLRGYGLPSMKERSRIIGGELSIDSRPGNGTTIQITVPIRMRKPWIHPHA